MRHDQKDLIFGELNHDAAAGTSEFASVVGTVEQVDFAFEPGAVPDDSFDHEIEHIVPEVLSLYFHEYPHVDVPLPEILSFDELQNGVGAVVLRDRQQQLQRGNQGGMGCEVGWSDGDILRAHCNRWLTLGLLLCLLELLSEAMLLGGLGLEDGRHLHII